MKLRFFPMVLVLGACDALFVEPVPGDGGVTRCTDFPSTEPGGADGGVTLVAVDGLDFPRSGQVCLEPGQRYVIQIDPHALASFEVEATSGSVGVTVQRGAASLGNALKGWVIAGKNPVTLTVSVTSTRPAVFSWGATLALLGPSLIGPAALSDGGIGNRPFEPTVDRALAPLFTPAPGGVRADVTLGLERAVEEVLDDARCDPTPTVPERYFGLELDAGSYRLTDLGTSAPYRLRALRADGGVAVSGMLSTLATLDFTLPAAERVAIGAVRAAARETCGFDGGLPAGLSGPARFDLR